MWKIGEEAASFLKWLTDCLTFHHLENFRHTLILRRCRTSVECIGMDSVLSAVAWTACWVQWRGQRVECSGVTAY